MENLDWSKGLYLFKAEKNNIRMTSDMLKKNDGYGNLLKNPTILRPIYIVSINDVSWKDMDDFALWLQESFKNLDDNTYYLLAWNASGFYWRKIKKFVKRFVPFAKFQVEDGKIIFNEQFKKSNSGKTYRIWLYLKEEPTDLDMLNMRPRKLKLPR